MRLRYKLFKLKLAISRAIHRFIVCPIKGHSMDTIHYTRINEQGVYKVTHIFCCECQHSFNSYEVEVLNE